MTQANAAALATDAESQQPLMCSMHPSAQVAPCVRCGAFLCEDCSKAANGRCVECHQRSLADPNLLRERVRDASGLLHLICFTSTLVLVASLCAEIGLMAEFASGVSAFASFFGLIFYGGAALTFLKWEHFAVKATHALGHDVGVTPGWSVGAWFIPFASMVWPYQTIRKMIVAVGGERALEASKVGAWWALWILSLVAANLYSVDEEPHIVLVLVSESVTIAAAVAAVRVIRTLSHALMEAAGQGLPADVVQAQPTGR